MRKSVLWLCSIAAVAVLAILVITSKHPVNPQPAASPPQMAVTAETNEVSPAPPEPVATPAPTPTPVWTPSANSTNAERTAVARELVKQLSEVGMQPGGITPEIAAKWNRDLESLVEQGTAAIAPLDEFFQSKADERFDTGKTNLLGEPSLRMAFIEVLFNIPAPENVELQGRLLQDTSDPAEVALLARQLEAQDPGKYHDLIVYQAQVASDQANHGQWPGRDTKPLLEILRNHFSTNAK